MCVTYRCIFLLKCLGSKTCYMVYDWCKVCWAIKTNVRETGRVGLGNTFDTYTETEREKCKFDLEVWGGVAVSNTGFYHPT